MTVPVLIFDLDNTLVECSKYYNHALDSFAEACEARLGVPRQLALGVIKSIDLECTKLPNAFARDRFPRSFEAASATLDIVSGRAVSGEARRNARAIGDAVFEAPYTVYRGVKSLLQQYQKGGWKLILCSKGDDEVQRRKVRINKLDRFFTPSTTYITLLKSTELVETILKEQDADRTRTWYVGDSMKDDIGPALAAGLGAVHITATAPVWGYEDTSHVPTHTISRVVDLSKFVPISARDRRAVVLKANEPAMAERMPMST